MSRTAPWSVFLSLLLCLVAGPRAWGQRPLPAFGPDAGAPIEVAVTCVELDLAALGGLGVGFDTSKPTMEKLASEKPAELLALVEGFARAGCARSKFSPRVVTHSGREARAQVEHSTLAATPELLRDGRIRVDVNCQVRRPIPGKYVSLPPTWMKYGVDLGLVAADGETVCLTHPGNTKMPSDSPEHQLAAFIFLTVRRQAESPSGAHSTVAPVRYSELPQASPSGTPVGPAPAAR